MNNPVPGSCGYPIISDKTLEFVNDPQKFIQSKITQHSSRIFQARFLNNRTVFVCSPALIKELLIDKAHNFEYGYNQSSLRGLYGDSILFETFEDAMYLRSCMMPVFKDPQKYQLKIDKLCIPFIDSLHTYKDGVHIYTKFKSLMTTLCLQLFLGLDPDLPSKLSQVISELATQHWHGITSVPISIKFGDQQSTYSIAVQAKAKLLEHIREILKNDATKMPQEDNSSKRNGGATVLEEIKKAPFPNDQGLEQHLLLFVSAIIPKAFASIITSFITAMAGDENKERREQARTNPQFLKHVLLEVERLWPPLFGGRRLTKKDTVLGNHKIPKDYAVFYICISAHRDPAIFPEPDRFFPERWSGSNAIHQDLVFCFGAGARSCIGTEFIQRILINIAQQLLNRYDWRFTTDTQNLTYKILPIARPIEEPKVIFHITPHHCD
ncbi:uncharacterized protein LOC143448796 [Clavelina lepadiformis]|uniref:Cytochrome P450 n=1 Tax=Clavelina lepadiformis TaxID=159417 RepID=A0ABP0GI29_CLALP